MTKGKEYYFEKIVDNAPVNIYTATNTAMMSYPYVLGRVGESSPTLSAQSREYIFDSGIGDDTTTEDVFDAALSQDADYVLPCDEIGDTAATTEKTVEMAERVMDTDMQLMIPLQTDERCNRVDHYYEQIDALRDIGYTNEIAVSIGGISQRGIVEQITETLIVSNELPSDAYIHVLGTGIHHEWAVLFRKAPDIIDSVDTSSVYRYVCNTGEIFDAQMKFEDISMPRGKNSTCLSTMLREFQLYLYNYAIGPDIRDTDAPTEFANEDVTAVYEEYC